MGRVSRGGAFQWLRSYDETGREAFNRIVKDPLSADYFVLANQFEPGGTVTTEDVTLFKVDGNGNLSWKKIYNHPGDSEFLRDFEILPNGNLILAGNDLRGLIFLADNSGTLINGVQMDSRVFRDVEQNSVGGFYAVATFGTTVAYVQKFDSDLLLLWEVRIPELTSVTQVFEGASGEIYVTGRGTFNNVARTVIIKMTDNNGPTVDWVRYLKAGSNYIGGSTWKMPNNQLAFTDARTLPNGFGQSCAFISVSDLDLNICETDSATVSLINTSPLPEGPILPNINTLNLPMGVTVNDTLTLDWMQDYICPPCDVTISATPINNCGMIQFTANATGPSPYSFQWCDGQTSQIIKEDLPCGTHNFCVTVTCADGSMASSSLNYTVSDPVPPTAICNDVNVALDANCMATVTVADINNNSFDNCAIDTMWVSPNIFTHCDTFAVTLTVVDSCQNVSTCVSQVIVEDKTAPMITCPQNVTVNSSAAPPCMMNISGLTWLSLSDNCGIADINHNITGASQFTGNGDVSGLPFNQGTSTVTYTAVDVCGNEASCSFTVTLSCDTCMCLGFDSLAFYQLPGTNIPGFNIPVSCNNQPAQMLPCIPNDGVYEFQGNFLCDDSCDVKVDYQVISQATGQPLFGGSSIAFPIGNNTSHFDLVPGVSNPGPGTYQLQLTGFCGSDTCICEINYEVPVCDSCVCGTYSDLMYRPTQGAPNIAAECSDTLLAVCDGLVPWTFSGKFLCDGNICPPITQMSWVLTKPSGTMTTGNMNAGPFFNFGIPPEDFDETGCYDLKLKAICGQDTCVCDFVVKVECDTCCDLTAFCEKIENNINLTVNNDSCKATLNFGDMGNCQYQFDIVDWGDQSPLEGPFFPGDMPMHQYSSSNTYCVSYWALEFDSDGFVCHEKFVKDTITVVCDSCKCVKPEGLSIFSDVDGVTLYNFMVSCDDTSALMLPCQELPNQTFNFQGNARCMPDSCLGSTFDWAVYDLTPLPTGVLAGTGTFGANGHFDIQVAYSQLTPGVLYEVVLTYFCGDEECTCSLKFIIEECCCKGEEIFCEKLENNVFVSVNEDSCKATLIIGNIDCDGFIQHVDWGDNNVLLGPIPFGSMPMHVYSGSGIYEICYLAIELDSNNVVCTEKEICDTIDLNCGTVNPDTCATVPMGIVSWWPMDEMIGDGSITDIIGSNHAMPKNGGSVGQPSGPNPMPGKVNGALQYVSVPGSQFAEVPNHGSLNFGAGDFSIDAWINTNMGTQTEPIVDKLGNLSSGYSLSIQGSNPYFLTLLLGTGNSVQFLQGPPIVPGQWNFVAVTVGQQNANFYVGNTPNGFVKSTVPIVSRNASNTRPLLIGNNPSNPHWNIIIDELEIFNKEVDSLSLYEIWNADTLGKCKPKPCQCGMFENIKLLNKKTGLSQNLNCNDPSSVGISCPPAGQSYKITGKLNCSPTSCKGTQLHWELKETVAPFNVVASGNQPGPWFSITLDQNTLTGLNGLYDLVLTGMCGNDVCTCVLHFDIAGCPTTHPCPCDPVEFEKCVGAGFSYQHDFESGMCQIIFQPNGLKDCYHVNWIIQENGLFNSIGSTTGNKPIVYTFPPNTNGQFSVYMWVTIPGTSCSLGYFRLITVNCLTVGMPGIVCDLSGLNNRGFDQMSIPGILGVGGSTEGWERRSGEPELLEGDGCTDPFAVKLAGKCVPIDIDIIDNPVQILPVNGFKISACYKANQSDLQPGTELVFRLSSEPQYEIDCTGDCVEIARLPILQPTGDDWATLSTSFCLEGMEGDKFLTIHVENDLTDDDVDAYSTILIDNICLEQMDSCSITNLKKVNNLEKSIKIFPNPFSENIHIYFEEPAFKEGEIQIVDLLGRHIFSENLLPGKAEHVIAVNQLPNGIYFIKILEDGVPIFVQKMIKQ